MGNFPVIGHMRFVLEAVGPELRQYIVTDNDEEDRDPRTAGRSVVWQQDTGGRSRILLATPK